MRHYADFFSVDDTYSPMMSMEIIDSAPDRWMDFYPHAEFEEICKTLLYVLEHGDKSLWITGNFGTGKTNAALVLQKMFMDEEQRVRAWFEKFPDDGFRDRESLEKQLFARRNEGILVIYDYNASALGPDIEFLVRLQKKIGESLEARGMKMAAMSHTAAIMERVRREGDSFFNLRDNMQASLRYLHPGIRSANQLEMELQNPANAPRILSDVEKVLHGDSIYLEFKTPDFRLWLKEITKINNLRRIVYIFDEFHYFVESNREKLKTFEEVTEAPGINNFFLVPVTHMNIQAYQAEGSESAKKANDRFYFKSLQMPNDTAFKLAKHALLPAKDADLRLEWKKERDDLWESLSTIMEKFKSPDDPSRQSFYDILPLHPMAAFLLKHLSEQARSNQRSFFEYLKGSADGTEFQDFIHEGGPLVPNKQFLTVDYLWRYFVERSDLGLDKEISAIGQMYKQIRERLFQNQVEDDVELRVLKAVLLFCLMDKLAPGGHERLKPTVENVILSFKGDSAIADVEGIILELAKKHCFSMANGHISLFTYSTVNEEEIEKYRDKFHEFLHEKLESNLNAHTKNFRQYFSDRFDIRATDLTHTNLTNISSSIREKYSTGNNNDDGSICLWFTFAKNRTDQLQLPQHIENIIRQLEGHRILMFSFPDLPFCHNNKGIWDEYIRLYAQYISENDSGVKKQIKNQLEEIENSWFNDLKNPDTTISVYYFENNEVKKREITWNQFKDTIKKFTGDTLKYCVDFLGTRDNHFASSSLKSYALAAINFQGKPGPEAQLIENLKKSGICAELEWFKQNAEHALGAIYALFDKKFKNTIGRGDPQSIRKVYIELKRAPYGMRCNALSAFALAFCLRHILDRNYQWTDGRMTRSLDSATLAEIIEAVVKDDGKGKLGSQEKLICRMSREERLFVEKAPEIFGFAPQADSSIDNVLISIQNRIEGVSAKVPLRILPEFINSDNEPKAEAIWRFVGHICVALSKSSKSRHEEHANAIREAGIMLDKDPELAGVMASCIKKENFTDAFRIYVDRVCPQLAELAQNVGDFSHYYCDAILGRCQETAGWLWSAQDISQEIDEIVCEYELVKLAKPLWTHTGFFSFKDLSRELYKTVVERLGLPKAMIESHYPDLGDFLDAVQSSAPASELKKPFKDKFELIKSLFFDPKKTEILNIVRNVISEPKLGDNDLQEILKNIGMNFATPLQEFKDRLREETDKFISDSTSSQIRNEWRRISGQDDPDAWALACDLPTRQIFANYPEAMELLEAIREPDKFAQKKLASLLEILRDVPMPDMEKCQSDFMMEAIPERYRQFPINPVFLKQYLHEKYGANPNAWPRNPDIDSFVKTSYRQQFAPLIRDSLSDKNPEEIKQKLLELVEENLEVGMAFWEKQAWK